MNKEADKEFVLRILDEALTAYTLAFVLVFAPSAFIYIVYKLVQ